MAKVNLYAENPTKDLVHIIARKILGDYRNRNITTEIDNKYKHLNQAELDKIEFDIKMTVDSQEVDINVFFEWLDKLFDETLAKRVTEKSDARFKTWKHQWQSTQSSNAKLSKLKTQFDSIKNQMLNIEKALTEIKSEPEPYNKTFLDVLNENTKLVDRFYELKGKSELGFLYHEDWVSVHLYVEDDNIKFKSFTEPQKLEHFILSLQ